MESRTLYRPAGVVVAAVLTALPGSAQTPTHLDAFLSQVEDANRRFADVDVAIAEGYRKLGPDFPGMGEHWIHPGSVIAGRLDPQRPPVLTYTLVGEERSLVGFAFTRVLGPGETVPNGPFPAEAWHDHTGGVDEESLLLSGPASMHPNEDGFRLSMVHVWTPLRNPDGTLAQNNWALPFFRAGLGVPPNVSSEAARGLSLIGVGAAFYEQVLRDGVGLEGAALTTAIEVFVDGQRHVGEWIASRRGRAAVSTQDVVELEEVWASVWHELRERLPPHAYVRIAMLGEDAGHTGN